MNYECNEIDITNDNNEKNAFPVRNRITLAKRELKMTKLNTKNRVFDDLILSELNQTKNKVSSEKLTEERKTKIEYNAVENKEKTPNLDENRGDNFVIDTFYTAHVEIKNINNDVLKILLTETPTHVHNDMRTRSASFSFSSFPFSSSQISITEKVPSTSTSFSASFCCPKNPSHPVRNVLYEREIFVKDVREMILSEKVRLKVLGIVVNEIRTVCRYPSSQ